MHTASVSVHHGFTLIELLVSVAIMMLFLGVSVAGFNQYNETQSLLHAGKEAVTTLRKVQKSALSGEKPADCSTSPLTGYQVLFDLYSYQYQINAICDPSTPSITYIPFPAGYEFEEPAIIRFATPVRGIGASSMETTTLHLRKIGATDRHIAITIDDSCSISDANLVEIP